MLTSQSSNDSLGKTRKILSLSFSLALSEENTFYFFPNYKISIVNATASSKQRGDKYERYIIYILEPDFPLVTESHENLLFLWQQFVNMQATQKILPKPTA